ncbi:MAG: hypothetical protein ACOY46_04795 [Bacillota bacterium]
MRVVGLKGWTEEVAAIPDACMHLATISTWLISKKEGDCYRLLLINLQSIREKSEMVPRKETAETEYGIALLPLNTKLEPPTDIAGSFDALEAVVTIKLHGLSEMQAKRAAFLAAVYCVQGILPVNDRSTGAYYAWSEKIYSFVEQLKT